MRCLRRIGIPLITTPQKLRGAFSLRLGHRAGLTRHWRLIQYRADTSLPTVGEAMIKVASQNLNSARRGRGEQGASGGLKPTSSPPVCELVELPHRGEAIGRSFYIGTSTVERHEERQLPSRPRVGEGTPVRKLGGMRRVMIHRRYRFLKNEEMKK